MGGWGCTRTGGAFTTVGAVEARALGFARSDRMLRDDAST